MVTKRKEEKTIDSVKRLRQVVTLGALTLALVHLLWPALAIDAITLALLAMALLPWLAPIFKSLEFPGGWKVEFQDLQKAAVRAEQAGLLAPSAGPARSLMAFQRYGEMDPNLALAALRIEIEKRLVSLAESRQVEASGRGVGQLLRALTQRQVLNEEERSVLAELTGLLDSAVHGASVDPRAAEWAMDVGPRVLKGLEDLAHEESEKEPVSDLTEGEGKEWQKDENLRLRARRSLEGRQVEQYSTRPEIRAALRLRDFEGDDSQLQQSRLQYFDQVLAILARPVGKLEATQISLLGVDQHNRSLRFNNHKPENEEAHIDEIKQICRYLTEEAKAINDVGIRDQVSRWLDIGRHNMEVMVRHRPT